MKNQLILLALAAVAVLSACKKEYEGRTTPLPKTAKQVKLAALEKSTKASPITASGVLGSQKEITFSFKIGGLIQGLLVDQGQRVRKGQRLGQLNLAEINAQVVQARNGYDKAVRDLARVEALYADTVATLEQKQNAKTAVDIAQAALRVAEFNQEYAQIISPIDGVVLKKMAETGELVSPGQPIYEIGSTDSKGSQVIKIGVSDRSVVKLSLGDSASIQFDAFPGKLFEAKVSEIAQEANPFTGSFDVELTLSNFHPELKNGFVGYAAITPSKNLPHYKIPMTALIEGKAKEAKIFTTKNQKTAEQKVVPVREINGEHFTVSEEHFTNGEWLVMEGGSYLLDGDSISIIK